jgi:hypothetical protein
MDLGEVVEINHPDFALTTPSPPRNNAIHLNCGRIQIHEFCFLSYSRKVESSMSVAFFSI